MEQTENKYQGRPVNQVKSVGKPRRVADAASGARLGFEEHLWSVADALRGKVEPAEYKHVVLSMLFLHSILKIGAGGFTVPAEISWSEVVGPRASRRSIDNLISVLEAANPAFENCVPRAPASVPERDLLALARRLDEMPLPADRRVARDLLGRVYEYFIGKFASAEGRSGGEYYTPKSVVNLLVEMLRPTKGTIYDPCCGTAGMFVQSEEFLESHGNSRQNLHVVGQESSLTTWRLAKMNLALHEIAADLGPRNGDTFTEDFHADLKAEYVIANPPFNQKAWSDGYDPNDARWVFGQPSTSNGNYAWIQHIFSHLAEEGVAGFVLSNGSLASDQGSDHAIRREMVERDIVECIVTLPSQLFYGTQIPACLWFISPNKTRAGADHLRQKTLFIDARSSGHLIDRTHAELSGLEIARIAETYHSWRTTGHFEDIAGFAYSASTSEIAEHKYALVPGRYVGFTADESRFDVAEVQRELPEAIARLQAVRSLAARAEAMLRGNQSE